MCTQRRREIEILPTLLPLPLPVAHRGCEWVFVDINRFCCCYHTQSGLPASGNQFAVKILDRLLD